MSELEDDFLGQDAGGHNVQDLNRQLFGEESDDEAGPLHPHQQHFEAAEPEDEQAALEDEVDHRPQPRKDTDDADYEEAEEAASSEPEDGDDSDGERRGKKSKVAKKGEKKKREAGGKDDKPKKKRLRPTGEQPKKGGKGERGAAKGGLAANRSRRTPAGEEEERPARPRRPVGEGGEEELSEEMQEADADRQFIDDAGVEKASDDEGPQVILAEEAEEAMDDEDHPFKRNKRRKEPQGNVELEIKDMLGKMEAAMETDFETVARNAGVELKKDAADNLVTDAEGHYVVARKGPPPASKSPAIAKLKLLPEVDLFLAQRKYHESFLAQGGLGVLKGWLEPYSDGTLPNLRVRTAVLKGLQALPIDTRFEDHKEMLRKSGLGKNVMFLFKCGEESAENRRMAKELVHKWSRPIFYDQEAEEAKKQLHQQQLLEARRAELERRRDETVDPMAAAARTTKAARIHALIPRASKLDYVNNPGSAADYSASEVAAAAPTAGGKAKQVDALTRRLREQQKRARDGNARAMKPSVEGRSIVLMK